MPFSPEYKDTLLSEQILRGRYRYDPNSWRGVSLPAKQLMKKMLTVNVCKRITLEQILNHPWMHVRNLNILKINYA